jgi:type II secretory pathway component HofQ
MKVHRPEAPESKDYTARSKDTQDIVVKGEETERLVGTWPEEAEFLDLEEQKVPVRDILERFAKISKLNFVIADEVSGEVTTRMERVRWTRALLAVLEAKDLVAVLEGNVVRILRREDWYAEMRKGS